MRLGSTARHSSRAAARTAAHQQQLLSLAARTSSSSRHSRRCQLTVHAKNDDADDDAPSTSYQNSLELTIKYAQHAVALLEHFLCPACIIMSQSVDDDNAGLLAECVCLCALSSG
jgi:hypothetical protein